MTLFNPALSTLRSAVTEDGQRTSPICFLLCEDVFGGQVGCNLGLARAGSLSFVCLAANSGHEDSLSNRVRASANRHVLARAE